MELIWLTWGLLAVVFGVPLVAALVMAGFGPRSSACLGRWAFAASALSAAGSLALMARVGPGGTRDLAVNWVADWGVVLRLRLDPLGLLLLAVVTVLTALAILYALPRRGAEDRPASFYSWMLFFLLGLAGTALAADTILFYVCWEFMLIPSAALIAFYGEGETRGRAALKYFIFTHAGAVCLLAAILYLYGRTRTTDLYALQGILAQVPPQLLLPVVALFVAGFGVKLALFPVHTWLPDTYAQAPLPLAVAMAGAMMSAGIYGLVRFVLTPFPPQALQPFALPLLIVAVVTQIYGAAMALAQKQMRRIVAYSSMSQMGYVLFGVASLSALGAGGSVLHLLNHGMAKALLFMTVGAVVMGTGAESLDQVGGLAKRMPYTAIACTVAALSLAGAPPLGGFVSEWMILAGGFGAGQVVLAIIAVAGSVLTAWYALWLVKRVFFGPLPASLAGTREPGAAQLAPMIILALGALVVGVYPAPFVDWVNGALKLLALNM